ncbi:hypothetical protein, partial [Methanobrevibacter sp.]|uniref:hypothetical protein n=1 Tax=Methanobrevibacter sp. TaxID=66852 RepID=UPI002E78459E
TFVNNNAGCGGAIYLNGGILELTDCVFINNTAMNYGGAIAGESKYSKGSTQTVSVVTLFDCARVGKNCI